MMTTVVAILISLAVAWILISPFFMDFHVGDEVSHEDQSLQDQIERCKRLLKDIELDFETGKLTEEEFEAIKNAQYAELAQILQKLPS